MKETRLFHMFSEKILIWGNGPFWAQILHILITLDLVEEFFFKFCIMKEANRCMKILLVVFQEKKSFGAI